MDREDYILLLETADEYEKIDDLLRQITGSSHVNGVFNKLDNIYDILLKYADRYYRQENMEELFFCIVEDIKKTPEERANILMNSFIQDDNINKCGKNN